MFQVWVVEVEQPVLYLTLAGRNNLLPVSLCSAGMLWRGMDGKVVLQALCLSVLPAMPHMGVSGTHPSACWLWQVQFLSFGRAVLIFHRWCLSQAMALVLRGQEGQPQPADVWGDYSLPVTNKHFWMAVATLPPPVSPQEVFGNLRNSLIKAGGWQRAWGCHCPCCHIRRQWAAGGHLRGWDTLPWSGVTRRYSQAGRSRHFRNTEVAVPSTGRCSQSSSLLMPPCDEALPHAFAQLTAGLISAINFLRVQQQA